MPDLVHEGPLQASAARYVKFALTAVAALVAAFGAITWWALESGGVAVIETRTPAGTIRQTHVWYGDLDGERWLEAGTPENPWFQDVRRDPSLTFREGGRSTLYRARPVDDASGHDRIRSLIRDKYGFRDHWVGLLVDTSRSVAVRLSPLGGDRDDSGYDEHGRGPTEDG